MTVKIFPFGLTAAGIQMSSSLSFPSWRPGQGGKTRGFKHEQEEAPKGVELSGGGLSEVKMMLRKIDLGPHSLFWENLKWWRQELGQRTHTEVMDTFYWRWIKKIGRWGKRELAPSSGSSTRAAVRKSLLSHIRELTKIFHWNQQGGNDFK